MSPRPGRLVVENTLGGHRLHDHNTDVVRDHVVQLPGGTKPFRRDRRPLRFLGLVGLCLQRARLTTALHRDPKQPRGHHEQPEDRGCPQLLGSARQGIESDLHRVAGQSHQQARHGDAPRAAGRDGIRAGQSCDQKRGTLSSVGGAHRLHDDGRHQQHDRHERGAAADDEREADQQEQRSHGDAGACDPPGPFGTAIDRS